MRAFRQILEVESHSLNILLPADFNAKRVEVIVLPLEKETKNKGIAGLKGKLNLTEEQYNDFQNDIKISREEWGKNI